MGATVSTAEQQNALTVLQSVYMELVGWGAFGRENDVLSQGAWTVLPHQRVRMVDPNQVATIPDQIPEFPYWWQDEWNPDGWVSWPIWPTNPGQTSGCDCCRAPDDLSIVTVVDPTNGTASTYIYDAFIGAWTNLSAISFTTEAPLSRRWAEPLSNVLAGRLATDYGQEVSPALQLSIRNGLQAMTSRYSDISRPTRSEYF
ncbi:MAG: hypothetical protein KGL20_05165 [Rhodospirillales bacterium]|nr:hypothetical protein [Rhodospirillales bacterium]